MNTEGGIAQAQPDKGSDISKELTLKRTVVSHWMLTFVAKASWHRLALAVVLLLSSFLNLFRLTNEDSFIYYAATVKDMLTSWHNFFFVSFDSGFVSVDKPPLGLWIQAASAYLFGFHGWSLLLPQALAGVLSVALLYYLVRRTFGPVAGLIAALVLAVTPISVATSRNNTMDMLLVLTVLLGTWAFIHAVESGRLRWLVVGALIVGLGFNIKMMEAYLVLPAFYLLYFLAAPVSWWRRFAHLGVATVVLLVVSLSWAVVVDLTPKEQRPYVGSSSDNSELNLILVFNGLDRLSGISHGSQGAIMPASTLGGPGGGTDWNGKAGPFRLLNQQYAGQIGWLLPLAVVGLLSASWQKRLRLPLDRRHQALILWGTWFVTAAVYFSIAGGQQRYYTVMLAPAVAALVGVGVIALWSDYRHDSDQAGWLLPMALVAIAVLHAHILGGYGDWSQRLTPVIVGLCLISAVVLVFMRLRPKQKAVGSYAAVATAVGMVALLIAPTVWASYTVFEGTGWSLPIAGPPPLQTLADGSGGSNTHGSEAPVNSFRNAADPMLMDYLLANQGGAEYLVAGADSMVLSPIILSTDEPVASLGGYTGFDPVFSTKQLANLVNEGAVRFFLIRDKQRMMQTMPAAGASSSQQSSSSADTSQGASQASLGGPQVPAETKSARWVQENCEQVPQELWRSSSVGQAEGPWTKTVVLYDCGVGRR